MPRELLIRLANTLHEEGEIDDRESFIDATIASAKGGGDAIGKTRRGKGVKILAIVDRYDLPISVSTHGQSPRGDLGATQFRLLHTGGHTSASDWRSAYDHDGLDDKLKQDGIDMIAPHRAIRKLTIQDGRPLRPYQRR